MGCGPSMPKDMRVENAKTPEELAKALDEFVKSVEKEIKEIKDKKFVGKDLTIPHLKEFNVEQLTKRVPYLEKLKESFVSLAKGIRMCNANSPLNTMKEAIQKEMYHYVHIYDDTNSFKEEEKNVVAAIEPNVQPSNKLNFQKLKEALDKP